MGVLGVHTAAIFAGDVTEQDLKSEYMKLKNESVKSLGAAKKALEAKNALIFQLADAQLSLAYDKLAKFSDTLNAHSLKVKSEKMRKNMETNTMILLKKIEDMRKNIISALQQMTSK